MLRIAAFALLLQFGITSICSAQDFETKDKPTSIIQLEALEQGFGISGGTVAARSLNDTSLELIKHFEGWEPKAYNDPAGYCTIGYGHLLALRPCTASIVAEVKDIIPTFNGVLTLEEGEALLVRDTALARAAVTRNVSIDLSDDEFGSLASFVFNVGERNFKSSTLLKRLNANRKDLAAEQFSRWIFSNGQEFRGLVIRRNCERTLFLSKLDLGASGQLDRSKCTSFGIAAGSGDPVDVLLGE